MILVIKVVIIWLLMAAGAVLNGVMRESILIRHMSEEMALPISGLSLSVIVFGISYVAVAYLPKKGSTYLGVGLIWVFLTLSFEYGFGHYALGKSWSEINEVFNLAAGNLFGLVMLVTLFSAWVAAKLRGFIEQ